MIIRTPKGPASVSIPAYSRRTLHTSAEHQDDEHDDDDDDYCPYADVHK
jgi:hypothetical protein